jgi:hypothetical protein
MDNPNFVVEMHKISEDRGVTWEAAKKLYDGQTDSVTGFYLSKPQPERRQTVVLVSSSGKRTIRNLFVTRPNIGRSTRLQSQEEVEHRFMKITEVEAEKHWKEQYEGLQISNCSQLMALNLAFTKMCIHTFLTGKCKHESEEQKFCEVGRRNRIYFVLTGSVIAGTFLIKILKHLFLQFGQFSKRQ